MIRPRIAALAISLAALAAPARAEEPTPPAQKEAAPPRSRLNAWRAGAQPPAEVPPTTIVRAAVRKGDKAAGERRRVPARAALPRGAIEIIWHAPGT